MDQLRPSTDINTPIIEPALNSVSIAEKEAAPNSTPREFDIENIKPENKLFTVDLMGDDADVKFASVKTPDARPEVIGQNTSYINPVPGIGNSSGSSITGTPLIKSRDELRSGVKAAIMVIDYVISLIAMKIAGDTRQQAHTADTSQKKLLEDVIVEYLFGKQQAMPLWLTLVFAIAGSYGLIIFAAIRQRSQINKNKKINQSQEPRFKSQDTGYKSQENSPVGNSFQMKQEDGRKYEGPMNIPASKQQLTLNKAYSDKNKDGVMEPVNNVSFTDTINPPRASTYDNPDKGLIADNAAHVRALISKGQYPMFRKSLTGKLVRMRYNENGMPIMAGKSPKLKRR